MLAGIYKALLMVLASTLCVAQMDYDYCSKERECNGNLSQLVNITSFVDENDKTRIQLSISQAEDVPDGITSVQIENSKNDTFSECTSASQSQYNWCQRNLSDSIFITNPRNGEIQAGCTYMINFSVGTSCTSKYYTVPDCTGKCLCINERIPNAAITDIQTIDTRTLKVFWKVNSSILDNRLLLKDIVYNVDSGGITFAFKANEIKVENFFYANYSLVTLPAVPQPNQNLTANFINGFYCNFINNYPISTNDIETNGQHFIAIPLLCAVLIFFIYICLNKRTARKGMDLLVNNVRYLLGYPSNHIGHRFLHTMVVNPHYRTVEAEVPLRINNYEIPRSYLDIRERVKGGQYGDVYMAKARNIHGSSGFLIVAVKKVKDHLSEEDSRAFLEEIEVLKKIGKHPNIVKLLGCCTLDKPYLMVLEFVPCGDLRCYLRNLRKQWENTPQTAFSFNTGTSDGSYIFAEHEVREYFGSSPRTASNVSPLPSPAESDRIFQSDVDTPSVANFTKKLNPILSSSELQNFALQIANGMKYLEKIGITHRDLAARNILINEYKVLKISDFGLSRWGVYINQKRSKLPLRWVAIECIRELKSDSKSDVWSFGVILWEIGTLGGLPYCNIPDNLIYTSLLNGIRLPRPEICTDELYTIMEHCWLENPEERPTFKEIVDKLEKRKVYVDFSQLNPMYIFPPVEPS